MVADNLVTTMPLGGGITSGGGIFSEGPLRISDSSILRNTASAAAVPSGGASTRLPTSTTDLLGSGPRVAILFEVKADPNSGDLEDGH
jgi:hypothetical protein